MNYVNSKIILERIKKAKRILVNCHRVPDPDSIGSALALFYVIRSIKKDVEVICPTRIPDIYLFIPGTENIKVINFNDFDLSSFDLFLIIDCSDWGMVTGRVNSKLSNIKTIVIDHHDTNTKFGNLNLVDSMRSSSAEILFRLFKDWKVEINRQIATSLLTGIIADTICFKIPLVDYETFEIAADLTKIGVDKNVIISNLYQNMNFIDFKYWGELITRAVLNKKLRFLWSAISYEDYLRLGNRVSGRTSFATQFLQSIKDTDFGIIMVEEEKGVLGVSMRSKGRVDVGEICKELGGGGHIMSAGATVGGLTFDNAVAKILKIAKKYALG